MQLSLRARARRLAGRMDRWGVRRRALAVAVLATLLWASSAAWHAAEPWARAGVLFTDGVLRLPVRPLTWVTSDPTHAELAWGEPGSATAARGMLTLPAGPGPHPALVLVLGAEAAGPDDPRVIRLTDALARLGIGVLYPRSPQLDAGVVEPLEIERLIGAWRALAAEPRVRPERVAFVGLSVGGSLSLVAAADARIAPEVWFVLAIGPYSHAGLLAAETASGIFVADDGRHEWEPRAITRRVLLRSLTQALGDEERAAALLERAGYNQATKRLTQVEAGLAAWLAAISPIGHLGGLTAPLYLLHDGDDRFIPWSHSEQIAAVRPPEIYHRTEIFKHVDPQPDSLGPLLTDGWRLWRLFARIFEEAR